MGRDAQISLLISIVLFLFVTVNNATDSYDYIVVGGGAGGAVIAGRLSQNGTYSVLLVDAGDRSQTSVGGTDYVASSYTFDANGNTIFRKPLTRYDVPAFAVTAQTFDTPNSPTPGFACDSPQGRTYEHSRILGGNSVHNNMQWNRQSIYSINSWNLSDWSYDQLLPYFKKSENMSATHLSGDTTYHGQSGPIQVGEAQALDKSGPIFNQACANAGYGLTNDFSGPSPVGCGAPLFNINSRGIRSSSLNEYIGAYINARPNLKIIPNAWVTKVLFLRASTVAVPKAVGVTYVIQNPNGTYNDSAAITVQANKEVILACGSLNSPKLLMLSGVGPAAQLQSLGIPLIVDSPVGKRQGIHPIVFTSYNYMPGVNNPNAISYPAIEYAINGTGLFASVGFPAQAFLKSNNSLPDYDLLLIPNVASATVGTLQVVILLVNPKQRNGQTVLQSAYYRDAPYFNYTLFQEQADVTALARSIQILRDIMNHFPANTTFGNETYPGPQYATLTQLQSFIKNGGGVYSTTHLFGGCQMGNAGDTLAPLDNHARVKGVTGLRVCDLSTAPGAFNGSPVANIIGWCEKVADYMLNGQ